MGYKVDGPLKNNKKGKWQGNGDYKVFCEEKEKIGQKVAENQSQGRVLWCLIF